MGERIPDVSVVLVNYKTPELLLQCIDSIYKETEKLALQLIVVDNDSQDNSEQLTKERFSQVQWINAGYNSGFARANNMGLKQCRAPYTLILNSDTIVKDNAIEKALAFYKATEHTIKLGFVGSRLIHFDGHIQYPSNTRLMHWSKLLLSNAFYKAIERVINRGLHAKRKHAEQEKRSREHEVQHEALWLGGTFWFFRTEICGSVDTRLDEDFFMYSEDEELCLRLRRMGYHHIYYPDAYVLHAEGGSFTVKEPKLKQLALSEWLFIMKVYGKAAYVLFAFITAFNLLCDQLFYLQSKWRGRVTGQDERERTMRGWKWAMLKQYFTTILFTYKQTTSSADKFLKHGG